MGFSAAASTRARPSASTTSAVSFPPSLQIVWMQIRVERDCNSAARSARPGLSVPSIDLEEKKHAEVGTGILRKQQCLVWPQNKLCLICDEICPYNAIAFRPLEGDRRPVVVFYGRGANFFDRRYVWPYKGLYRRDRSCSSGYHPSFEPSDLTQRPQNNGSNISCQDLRSAPAGDILFRSALKPERWDLSTSGKSTD